MATMNALHVGRAHALPHNQTQGATRRASHAVRWPHGRGQFSVTAAGTPADLAPLKKKLMDVVAAKPELAYWTEEARPVLDSIIEAIPEDQVPEITAEGIRGKYKNLLNSNVMVEEDNSTTLGKLCFNQFEPKDLQVKLLETHILQGVESPDQYSLVTVFEVLEGDLKGIVGEQKVLGRYEVKGEQRGRLDIFFSGIQIAIKESCFTEAWVTTLAELNENMEESGIATVKFPNEIVGFRDFKICDDDVTVTVGDRGSYAVIVRD